MKSKTAQRIRRHARVRAKIKGTSHIPRLAVFKSNKHIYAQLIDDVAGKTLAAASDMGMKEVKGKPMKEAAKLVGTDLAKKAKAKKIEKAVFDKGGFKYIGRIAALATGAREGGLVF